MSVVLLVIGSMLALAGCAGLGSGIVFNELTIAPGLIAAGAVGLVGGAILIGLAAVLGELVRLGQSLKQPVTAPQPAVEHAPEVAAPAPAVAREPVPEPRPAEVPAVVPVVVPATAPMAPAPTPAVEVSASAIERLRSSIPRPEKTVPEAEDTVPLSPNGQHPPHLEPAAQIEPAPRSAGAAAVETREPRLDFLFRSRSTRPAPQQESFDALWPKRGREGQPDPRLEVARAPLGAAPSPAQVDPEPLPPPPQRSVAILKSGVVDGMAYTLYADGSIEAQLPRGTVRFGSIAELRAHIESNA